MALLLNAGDTVSRSYSYTQPSPLHPSLPEGTGERTGNLFVYPYSSNSGAINNVLWTVSENGHIKGVGTTDAGTNFFFNRNLALKAGTYTLKIYGKHIGMMFRIYDSIKQTHIIAISPSDTDSFTTFTLDSDTSNDCRVYFNISSAGVDVDIDCDIMLNSGSTALPYEPYGYKIPISSANTTTPVYLGEVETTRKIKKLVFDGTENWTLAGSTGHIYRLVLDGYYRDGTNTPYCTHYVGRAPVQSIDQLADKMCALLLSDSGNNYFYINDSSITSNTVADFKSYLAAQYAAGTPVTVWYVLATPETAVVNEPLMRIGDYADTLSMEQAGVQIPTLKRPNTTVIDVTTSLPPSEVYAKYRGSKTQKYDLFLAANGDSFEAKNGQSLYIGDDT